MQIKHRTRAYDLTVVGFVVCLTKLYWHTNKEELTMSKQSRAKNRARRARRKDQGTGAMAMYVSNLNRMSDANHYNAQEALLDQLHKILCDRRVFKDHKFMELFRDNFWGTLEREIAMHHSNSPKRLMALDLLAKIMAIRNKG